MGDIPTGFPHHLVEKNCHCQLLSFQTAHQFSQKEEPFHLVMLQNVSQAWRLTSYRGISSSWEESELETVNDTAAGRVFGRNKDLHVCLAWKKPESLTLVENACPGKCVTSGVASQLPTR